MKYLELKGLCKNCLGCNKLDWLNWQGTYRCKYATATLNIEQIREELKKK